MTETRGRRANYRGDMRQAEYIAGRTLDGRALRAIETSYDEATNVTTIAFTAADETWGIALDQEAWAQRNMHVMFPEFFVRPS